LSEAEPIGLDILPIRLDRIALRNLVYSEVARTEPLRAPSPDQRVSVKLEVNASLRVADENVEIVLALRVMPDPDFVPVRVDLTMSAFFTRDSTVDQEKLSEFASGAALRILFPYLREVVSNVTGKGLYPPVWLDPIQLIMLTTTRPNVAVSGGPAAP
jgi:preprotein translocase subunit SecB